MLRVDPNFVILLIRRIVPSRIKRNQKSDFFPFLILREANDTNIFVSRIHELTNIMRSIIQYIFIFKLFKHLIQNFWIDTSNWTTHFPLDSGPGSPRSWMRERRPVNYSDIKFRLLFCFCVFRTSPCTRKRSTVRLIVLLLGSCTSRNSSKNLFCTFGTSQTQIILNSKETVYALKSITIYKNFNGLCHTQN